MKATIGIGIAFFVAILVTSLQRIFYVGSSEQILSSLSQADATIFALTFTIPIVAAQISRYSSAKKLLRVWNVTYMIVYMITVFLPLTISQSDTLQVSLVFFLSGFCGGFVIYYFTSVEDQLAPHRQLQDITESLYQSKGNSWKGVAAQMMDIIFRASEHKDYDVYREGLKKYSELTEFALKHLGPEAKMQVLNGYEEIGFQATADYISLRFFCDELGRISEDLTETKNQYSRDLAISWRTRLLISLAQMKLVGLHPFRTLIETYISDSTHGDEPTRTSVRSVKDEIVEISKSGYVAHQDFDKVFESLEAKYKIEHKKPELQALENLKDSIYNARTKVVN
jgi:hypothetical protein